MPNLLALALLDEETSQTLRQWKAAICNTQPQCDLLPPHITLGIYQNGLVTLPQLQSWAKQFASCNKEVCVNFSHIGIFGSRVCFAAPVVDESLLTFHRLFHTQWDEAAGAAGEAYSLTGGEWTPHCTLFMGEDSALQQVIPTALHCFTPLHGRLTSIAVGYEMQQLTSYPLQQ